MQPEYIILIIATVPVLVRASLGWRRGLTTEIRSVLVYLFALLVALRYWQPVANKVTPMLPIDSAATAAWVFFALFFVASIASAVVTGLRGKVFQSVNSNPLDQILGLAAGVFSGSILAGALLLIVSLTLPARWPEFDPGRIPSRVDHWPYAILRAVEDHIVRAPGSVLLPDFEPQDATPEGKRVLTWN